MFLPEANPESAETSTVPLTKIRKTHKLLNPEALTHTPKPQAPKNPQTKTAQTPNHLNPVQPDFTPYVSLFNLSTPHDQKNDTKHFAGFIRIIPQPETKPLWYHTSSMPPSQVGSGELDPRPYPTPDTPNPNRKRSTNLARPCSNRPSTTRPQSTIRGLGVGAKAWGFWFGTGGLVVKV